VNEDKGDAEKDGGEETLKGLPRGICGRSTDNDGEGLCFADETASKCCGIDWVFPEAAAAATASAGLSKEDKFPPPRLI